MMSRISPNWRASGRLLQTPLAALSDRREDRARLRRSKQRARRTQKQRTEGGIAAVGDAGPQGREAAARFQLRAIEHLYVSLDRSTSAQAIVDSAVPWLADLSLFFTVQAGAIACAASAGRDSARHRLVEALPRLYPDHLDQSGLVADVVRTGQPILLGEVGDFQLRAVARDAQHLELWRAIGLRSFLVVPLAANDKLQGVLFLGMADSNRRYARADLEVAESYAAHAARAFSHAEAYTQLRQRVSESDAGIRDQHEFVGGLLHDLKSPLTVIDVYVQMLERDLPSDHGAEWSAVRSRLARIADATRALREMVDRVRNESRPPAVHLMDALTVRGPAVDLLALARELVDELQLTTERHRIRVRPMVPALPGPWDALDLRRILENLLSNAIKYSPKGGPILVTVDRKVREGAPRAEMKVQDAGIGIAAEDLPVIFTRYVRAHREGGEIEGSGVGLAVVRELVEHYGGTVSAESQEGVGSIFTVQLPIHQPGRQDDPP